jgi:hypothetical protein
MEAKVLVETLGLWSSSFVKIFNSPHLVLSFVVVQDSNSLAFFVLGSFDLKYLTRLPIDELVILELEDLPPS